MSILCTCLACGAKLKVDDKAAGKKFRCPKCSQSISVPALDSFPQVSVIAPSVDPNLLPPVPRSQSTPAPAFQPTPQPVAPPPPAAKAIPRAVPVARPVAAVPVTPVNPAPVPQPEAVRVVTSPTAEAAFSVTASEPQPAAARTAAPKTNSGKASKNNTLLIVGGSIGACVLVGVIGLAVLLGGGKKNGAGASNKTLLVLNWPVEERKNAKVLVGNKPIKIPAEGAFEIPLKPGKHDVIIQRRNYEMVGTKVELAQNQRFEFKPEWKENVYKTPETTTPAAKPNTNEVASNEPEQPTVPSLPQVMETGESKFNVGGGIVPRGFEGGWIQSLSKAMQRAAAEKKEILLLFGSSDGSPKTVRLAKALREAGLPTGELAEKYIPLVIDFPHTSKAGNNVLDRRQNMELARDYGIEDTAELPVVVLADEKGLPYAVEREWAAGYDDIAANLSKLSEGKTARDEMLANAMSDEAEDKIKGAVAAVKWIVERKLIWNYREDIHNWFTAVEKQDPDNAKGNFEVILEAEILTRLRTLNPDDNVAVADSLGVLDSFLKKRKFQDPDRGAKLHFLAGQILIAANDQDQGMSHLEKASSYEPKNRELRERMAGLKKALANKDVLGNGTGFVIAEGGYMLTNRHVVEGPGKLAVRLPNVKEPLPAKIIKIDEELDIALVKIEFPKEVKPRPLPIANTEVRLSMGVSAYGFPSASTLGESLKATTGTVSSLPNENTRDMITLDVLINPGNSGGPLCDKRGNVVGMVTAKTSNGFSQDSYGLAIKAASLKQFLKENLPAESTPPAPATTPEKSDWADVTEQVQESVFLLLKVK